ncbi:hypothetical protein IGI47_000925 [Enterococcus sp. AZ191]|uniref:PTS transporter subunit IIC n=1 Tax=Enterococcus sp. AZ191 TaxID=2774639 RepID=UPI003F1F0EEB
MEAYEETKNDSSKKMSFPIPAKIITGTIISFVGFSMIILRSSILAETLTAFSKLFNSAFHLTAVVPSNEAMT